jgi:tetratricopeptide (TPR) repeat protein
MSFIIRYRFLFAFLVSLSTTLVASENGFSNPANPAVSHKEAPRWERNGGRAFDSQLFTTIPKDQEKTFKLIVDAHSPDNLEQAILKTKSLMKQKGAAASTAACLLGDLYLRKSHNGANVKWVDEALAAFGKAVSMHPSAENAQKTLLKKGYIYFERKLYPEALGNFQRAISQNKNSPQGIAALIGLAQSLQEWRRWNQVIKAVRQSDPLPLSPADRQAMQLIEADTLYQLARFEDAYKLYKIAIPDGQPFPKEPRALFGYGESAYRTGRFNEMKTLMKLMLRASYEINPKDPVAPLAMARLGSIYKLEGDTFNADMASDIVYAMGAHIPNVKAGMIMIATGNLATINCPNPCTSGVVDINVRQLTKAAKSLLQDAPFAITSQGAIFDGLAQLIRYHRYYEAEDVYTRMVVMLPPPTHSPYTLYVKKQLHQVVREHFDTLETPKEIVELHHRFRMSFSQDSMKGEAGLKIANSYLALGNLSEALNLYYPVAENKLSTAAKEALYQQGLLLAKLGEMKKAEQAMVEYRIRYPNDHAILAELGHVYGRQEMFESASIAYEGWLLHYPEHENRDTIYPKLIDAYQRQGDLPNLISAYQKWIAEIPREAERPYMALADAYHRHKQHPEAIRYYDLALKFETHRKEIDWALLRMADSYEAIGEKQQGEDILRRISKEATDPMIRQIALEKRRGLKGFQPTE